MKNRRRIHTYPPSPAITYVCGCGHPPPAPDIPVLTTMPGRPHPGTHAAPKPIGSVPGNPRDARTSAWVPLDDPPAPPGSVGGRVWVRGCCSALMWWPGSRGPRTCPWPPGRVSGRSCGMAVDGRGIVGSILRTIPRPSTAIPQVPPVVPHYINLEKYLRDVLALVDRTGYTSSDGMYLVEQTDLVEQPGDVDRRGEASSEPKKACRHSLVHADPAQIPNLRWRLMTGITLSSS